MAIFLSENDVKQLLTVTMAIDAVESAHRDLANGLAQDTPRARTRLPQTVLHMLHGALLAQGVIGYKAYTTNRSGNRFLVHLFDSASGVLLAVIEADYLGMIRTGADRILALNNYEMALQIGGRPPVVARKPDYLSDPPFAGQFDENPFHDPERDIMPPPAARMKLHVAPDIEQPPPGPGEDAGDWPEQVDPAVVERGMEDPYLLERLLELWR